MNTTLAAPSLAPSDEFISSAHSPGHPTPSAAPQGRGPRGSFTAGYLDIEVCNPCIDLSNVSIAAQKIAAEREPGWGASGVRLHFANLLRLATAGRPLGRAVCVGSSNGNGSGMQRALEAIGVHVELYERGRTTNREQAVDQCLQLHMLRLLCDVPSPQIVVLLTGDGAGYENGSGFHRDAERLAARGWMVEVVSWDTACNRRLRAWAREIGAYVALEPYYESVTFIPGQRSARPLNLTHRPKARPHLTSASTREMR